MSDRYNAGRVSTSLCRLDESDTFDSPRAPVELDTKLALRHAVRLVRAALQIDAAYAGEVINETDTLKLAEFSGMRTNSFADLVVPAGTGVGGLVAVLRHPIAVADYLREPTITHEFDDEIVAEGLVSVLAVPILWGHRFLGVLYAATRQPHVFERNEIELVERVARDCGESLDLSQRVQEMVEIAVLEDRRRLAISLHDSVGAMLFGVSAAVRRLWSEYPDDCAEGTREILAFIENQASLAAAKLRSSLDDMAKRPDQLGLEFGLTCDCSAFSRRTGITARVVVLSELPNVGSAAREVLREVACEALLNVEKHAKASSVVITLGGDRDGVAMVVTDDGVGLCEPGSRRGIGLDCIMERLQKVGGTGMLTRGDDGGCMMRAWVPC